MTATATYTYDDTLPHRPSVDELGGDQKLDDEANPPGVYEPEGAAWNNMVRLHAAMARMLPSAIVSLAFPAGVPTVSALATMGRLVVAADFALTDVGNGVTRIEWSAGLLPDMEREPCAFVHAQGFEVGAAATGTREVTVHTTAGGIGADAPVTVWIC